VTFPWICVKKITKLLNSGIRGKYNVVRYKFNYLNSLDVNYAKFIV